MTIDTNRLVQIANELQTLDSQREQLLTELHNIAQGISGAPAAPRRGRPIRSPARAVAPIATPGRKPRAGLTTDIVEFLKGGGAYTAGEILAGLKLPKSKGRLSTISTTLVRLAKEGRAKKDRERGYRAA